MKLNLESNELTNIARTWTTIHEFECNSDEIGRENLYYNEEKMLYPSRWKKITVNQSKVLKNRLFREKHE